MPRVAKTPAKTTRGRKAAPEVKERKSRASKQQPETKVRRSRKVVEEVETKSRRKPVEEQTSRRKKQEVVEEPPTSGRKRKAAEEVAETSFNPYANIDETLDSIEKHIGLSDASMAMDEKRQSTGLLMQDIVLGGGITAGWYTNFGQEQSCKTTDAVTLLISCLNSDVPVLGLWDFEGSASPDYLENIMRNMGVKSDVRSIFGVRDEKSGNWIHAPRVRYRSEAIAEKFFDYIASLQRKLPDKKKIGDNWYYIYEDTKENRKIVGDSYDMNYWRKTKMLRVPAKDGTLQALIIVDSYPAMLPEKQDVDDPNSAIGVQARMFADQLKRVKGKMRSKRMAVVGINQLRLRPMVMCGSPEYEPCGEALKLFSDCRMKFTSRALSAIPSAKGKGQIEEEPSVTYKKGVDNYRYIHVRAHKNKLSRPYLECFLRLWITDAKGNAQGFDPVFDTYEYLRVTGQLQGSRTKGFILKFSGNEATKPLKWLDFKRLILGDRSTIKQICSSIGMKPVILRDKCFAQIAAGKGIDMFNDHSLESRGESEESEESDD